MTVLTDAELAVKVGCVRSHLRHDSVADACVSDVAASHRALAADLAAAREALEALCETFESEAARAAYNAHLGAGEWEAFLSDAKREALMAAREVLARFASPDPEEAAHG